MWKDLAMSTRTFYAVLWSIPGCILLQMQGQNWFPAVMQDFGAIILISFVIQYPILHTWMQTQDSKEACWLKLDQVTIHSLLLLIAVAGFLFLLVYATSSTGELPLKAALAYACIFLASTHTACACTRYCFRLYGRM
jgi:hypothetical protein